MAGLLGQADTMLHAPGGMGHEVVLGQDEVNARDSLPADGGALLISGRNGEQQRRSAVGIRCDPNPTLSAPQVRVLDQVESQVTDVVFYFSGIVIHHDLHSFPTRRSSD